MNNISSGYPNPVLGIGDDVAGEFNVDVRLEWLADEQVIEIKLGYFCSDDSINSFITREKIEFIALCRCGSTLSTWILQEGTNRLSWSMIRDKFTITPYLIAKENIKAYYSQNFAPIFAEVKFNIERGAVLAVAGDKVFDLNPIETNRVLKSLFHFQDYAGNIIDYELERNTIAIKIPRFGQPKSLKKQLFNFSNWLSVMLFVQPALERAFEFLQNAESENEFKWMDILEGYGFGDLEPYIAAQKVLEQWTPLQRLTNELQSKFNSEDDE